MNHWANTGQRIRDNEIVPLLYCKAVTFYGSFLTTDFEQNAK